MVRGVIYSLVVLLLLSLAFNIQMLELANMMVDQAEVRDARIAELEDRSHELTAVANILGGYLGGR